MRALARVGMLVKMSTVELREAVSISWKMRWSPIKNHADPGLMAAVHKFHELGGCAEAARGGEVAERLVAPGAVIRVLHDGEQLDVGIAELFYIGNELIAQLAISQPAVVVVRKTAPGA